ncbi:hypothetical protein PACTADRAFT_51975 [Pachysolen tannophilus NRRL Y-2460]|uniref:mannan endo-1,6-alpha-mannosidase n=1 Tax=Pachysolen tannophilus NRRL Y-2460 TaxID=669874 RepID=A0A1E4TNR1_PACTA|nr:hypothetical protein PACTADRAFT_51975 [Pachysolen tannophilus NRRL Y-2460]
MDYYEGDESGGTVGYFSGDSDWWEYGQAFSVLIDHWYYCENNTYESIIYKGLVSQLGTNNDFITKNQSATTGNDDESFWALVALNAYEKNFKEPSDSLSWLDVVVIVFNKLWYRWDSATCNGGIRWQINSTLSGYDYKNSISNGNLFLLGASLYRHTGNDTYLDSAQETWNWVTSVGYVANDSSDVLSVYDGADASDNCTNLNYAEWSYNYGTYLVGAAYLGSDLTNASDVTSEIHLSNKRKRSSNLNFDKRSDSQSYWNDITKNIWGGCETFFNSTNSIMYERTCQGTKTCNDDERCFKSIFTRYLYMALVLDDSLIDSIGPYLEKSAEGAAQSCSGGSDGITCGLNWFYDGWDGYYGLEEQMNALEIMISLLAL